MTAVEIKRKYNKYNQSKTKDYNYIYTVTFDNGESYISLPFARVSTE